MNKCEGCGARVDLKEQCCPYCGLPYPQQNKEVEPKQDYQKILNQPAVDPNYNANLVKKMIPGIIMFFFIPIIGVIMIINAVVKSKKA